MQIIQSYTSKARIVECRLPNDIDEFITCKIQMEFRISEI